MRQFFLFVVTMMTLVLAACSTVEVAVKPNTEFSQASSITVECEGIDWANLQSGVEQALLRNGFDVISPAVAQTRLQHEKAQESQLSSPSKQGIQESDVSKSSTEAVREYKSVYLLKYRYANDGMNNPINFAASIVDLRTGQVVAAITENRGLFSGTSAGLANDVGDKLSQALSK